MTGLLCAVLKVNICSASKVVMSCYVMLCRPIILCLLNCITENVQVTEVRMLASPAVCGPAIEPRLGQDFLQPSGPALGPTQPPVHCVPALFPRGKAAGAWR